MDDFTPYGSSFQEALSNLGKVLSKCIEMNLSLSPEKCEFLMIEGTRLGHTISRQGLQVDPSKITIIKRVPPPQKDKLVSAPIMRGPNRALPFQIHTDASNKSIGATLGQVEEKLPYAIYFVRKNLSKAEMNYMFHLTIVEKLGKENVVADFLSRLDLPGGEEETVDDQMPDEHLFAILVLFPWFADIANYLVSAQFPPHLSSKEKSRIVRKSASFTWIGGNLFKLGPDQILRHCVSEEEVFDILLTCHDGPCGGHFAAKRTAFKILQAGYYWPTLHQDVRRYISQCDRC
eukprot:PITA_29944